MDLNDIEAKLRQEAKYGRTPKERRAQIRSVMKSLHRGVELDEARSWVTSPAKGRQSIMNTVGSMSG
jgi:hypothetical protein